MQLSAGLLRCVRCRALSRMNWQICLVSHHPRCIVCWTAGEGMYLLLPSRSYATAWESHWENFSPPPNLMSWSRKYSKKTAKPGGLFCGYIFVYSLLPPTRLFAKVFPFHNHGIAHYNISCGLESNLNVKRPLPVRSNRRGQYLQILGSFMRRHAAVAVLR